MRWVVALLSLTVICSILGSIGTMVVGKRLDAEPSGSASWPSAQVASGEPGSSVRPAKAAIQ
jgi:hypothetical protein